MGDVEFNGMSGRKVRWLMIAVGFESGEVRVVGGLVGGGGCSFSNLSVTSPTS